MYGMLMKIPGYSTVLLRFQTCIRSCTIFSINNISREYASSKNLLLTPRRLCRPSLAVVTNPRTYIRTRVRSKSEVADQHVNRIIVA
jgi:hypothetical protein